MYRIRFALFPKQSGRERLAKWTMHRHARPARAPRSGAAGAAPGRLAGAPAVGAPSRRPEATIAARYAIVCLPSIEWGFRMQRPQQLARRFAQSGSDVLFARHSFGAQLAARQAEPGIEEIELPGVPGTNPYRDRMGDEDGAPRGGRAARRTWPGAGWGASCAWSSCPSGRRSPHGCARSRAATSSTTAWTCTPGSRRTARRRSPTRRACSRNRTSSSARPSCLVEHARPQREGRRAGAQRRRLRSLRRRAGPHARPSGPSLTIGYYGAIADWFDSALVAGIARLRPQWRIVLVGSTWSADTAPLEAAAERRARRREAVRGAAGADRRLGLLRHPVPAHAAHRRDEPGQGLRDAGGGQARGERGAAGARVDGGGRARVARRGRARASSRRSSARVGDGRRRRRARAGARSPRANTWEARREAFDAGDRGDRAAGVDRRGHVQQPRAQRAVPAQRAAATPTGRTSR